MIRQSCMPAWPDCMSKRLHLCKAILIPTSRSTVQRYASNLGIFSWPCHANSFMMQECDTHRTMQAAFGLQATLLQLDMV